MPFLRQSNERTTYDAVDIATGKINKKLYIGNLSNANILSEDLFYADTLTHLSSATIDSSSYIKAVTKDFNFKFEKSRIIEGNVIVNIPLIVNTRNGATNYYFYAHVYLIKVDKNQVEKALGNQASRAFKLPTAENEYQVMTGITFNIDRTRFRKGENLRIKVEAWGKRDSTYAFDLAFGADPKSRATNLEYWNVPDGTVLIDWQTAPSIATTQIGFKVNF